MSHSKTQKILNKECPECGHRLFIVLRTENINGVEYSKSYEVCKICFYEELYRDYTRGKNIEDE